MKIVLSILCLLGLGTTHAQQCGCEQEPGLSEAVSCVPERLQNGAQLYWQYNCDSSWLVFRSPKGQKKILYALELIGYTERLGYSFAQEYKSVFLIRNRLISGCCTPEEFLLFDKENARLKKKLGTLVYLSEEVRHPFVVYFNDPQKLDQLCFFNINTNTRYLYRLPKGRLTKTMKLGAELYPEYLFQDAAIKDGWFSITYRYKTSGKKESWHYDTVKLNLLQHGF